jgi:hypothetical protein
VGGLFFALKLFLRKKLVPQFLSYQLFRMLGEMITKFIQKLTAHIQQILPQSRSKRVFCRQSEFSF